MATWELYDEGLNFQVDDVDEQGTMDHYQQHHHIHGISRLATCSNSTIECDNLEDEYDGGDLPSMLSRLSIESIDFNGDADDEEMSSDDDTEKKAVAAETYHSLPGTPVVQHLKLDKYSAGQLLLYSSENEMKKSRKSDHRRRRGGKKRVSKREENKKVESSYRRRSRSSFSGESESGGGGGMRVMTRPKGGEHSLSMDMEEVKACRDLGFDLELDMKMMPTSLTISVPPVLDTTTSSSGSSPMSNWRISSPGDEPKDVKARLKVWAQAVALASTSPRSGGSC